MTISPADGQEYAKAVRSLYEQAEQDILEKITRRIARGVKTDPNTTHWLDAKLKEVRVQLSEIDRVLSKLSKGGPKTVENLIIQGYISGMLSADTDLSIYEVPMTANPLKIPAGADMAQLAGSFGVTHVAAINALVAANTGGLQNAHTRILRSTKDAYRNILSDILGSAVGGVDTRQQATQKALNKFADSGIGKFLDKNGKKWDIATYAEMATRTGMAHAHIEGHVNRMVEQGYDLVIVSDHPEESPLCRPHEGKVYSVKEGHPEYKPLSWAIANGLFHPNCRHTINAYIEGLTEPPHTTGDPKGYEIRKHHRELERKVRFWKKREIAAITDDEKRLARKKVRHWQGELRSFTAETGRRRMYTREQVHLRTFGMIDKDVVKVVKESAVKVSGISHYAMQSTDGRHLRKLLSGADDKDMLEKFNKVIDDLGQIDMKGSLTAMMDAARQILRGEKVLDDFKPKKEIVMPMDRRFDEEGEWGFLGPIPDVREEKMAEARRSAENYFMEDHDHDDYDDYIKEASAHLKKLIEQSNPTIRVSPSVLGLIVKDGRFKTQFETGKSNGMFDPETRSLLEHKSFGAPLDMSDNKRPVYGLMDNPSGTTNKGDWYGSVKVRLKQETIRDRSTFTMGDSLDYRGAGMKMSNPDARLANADILAAKDASHIASRSYTEIQIFGGVSLDDIASIDVSRADVADSVKFVGELDELYKMGIDIWINSDLEDRFGNGNKKIPWSDFQAVDLNFFML